MYFWKIEKLKEDIKSDRFSEKDRFAYFIVGITLSAIGMETTTGLVEENPNIWDMLSAIGNVIIAVVGTVFAYRANGSANGKDFLGRFLSIGFVVSIRFLVFIIPLLIALAFLSITVFPEVDENMSSLIFILPFLSWYALLFWYICRHINDVQNFPTNMNSTPSNGIH